MPAGARDEDWVRGAGLVEVVAALGQQRLVVANAFDPAARGLRLRTPEPQALPSSQPALTTS
jgi:hypothetical protein